MGPPHRGSERQGSRVMLDSRSQTVPTQQAFEAFLYYEAALLDDWQLDDWFALFVEGGTYHIPSSGGTINDDPATQLFYIADDYVRLRERIVRLKNKEAHAEFPRSIQQHSITNVRVTGSEDAIFTVECNFITHRSKNRVVDTYFGRSRYRLDCSSDPFKIVAKRSYLAMDILYQGKISIIL
jgi:p-cumate 2,3-dioxygenase beta subunit